MYAVEQTRPLQGPVWGLFEALALDNIGRQPYETRRMQC